MDNDTRKYESFPETETRTGGTIPPQRLMENHEPKVGDLLANRYQVMEELGRGGMGVVYRCFDSVAGVEVAVKALPQLLSNNKSEMEEVKDNFQLVSGLVHTNIAVSKTLERDPSNGAYYLVMELVEGDELRRWMRGKRAATGERFLWTTSCPSCAKWPTPSTTHTPRKSSTATSSPPTSWFARTAR